MQCIQMKSKRRPIENVYWIKLTCLRVFWFWPFVTHRLTKFKSIIFSVCSRRFLCRKPTVSVYLLFSITIQRFSNYYFSSFVECLDALCVMCLRSFFFCLHFSTGNNNFHYVAQNTANMVCVYVTVVIVLCIYSVNWIRTTKKIPTKMLVILYFFPLFSISVSISCHLVVHDFNCDWEWKACVSSVSMNVMMARWYFLSTFTFKAENIKEFLVVYWKRTFYVQRTAMTW